MQNFRYVTDVTTLDVPIATREAVINYIECKIGSPNLVTSVTFFSLSSILDRLIPEVYAK